MACHLEVIKFIRSGDGLHYFGVVVGSARPNTTIARCHVSKTFQVLNHMYILKIRFIKFDRMFPSSTCALCCLKLLYRAEYCGLPFGEGKSHDQADFSSRIFVESHSILGALMYDAHLNPYQKNRSWTFHAVIIPTERAFIRDHGEAAFQILEIGPGFYP